MTVVFDLSLGVHHRTGRPDERGRDVWHGWWFGESLVGGSGQRWWVADHRVRDPEEPRDWGAGLDRRSYGRQRHEHDGDGPDPERQLHLPGARAQRGWPRCLVHSLICCSGHRCAWCADGCGGVECDVDVDHCVVDAAGQRWWLADHQVCVAFVHRWWRDVGDSVGLARRSSTPVPTTWTWTGLTPGTSYRFGVIAVNAVGWGSAWSAPSPAISTLPGAVPAGAPTGVVGSNATATSVTLNWTPPANDGGSPITRYVLRLSTDGGATWATPWGYPPIITPVPTTWTWTGLTPGTSYRFEVIAVTAVGWGSAWSAPSPAISTLPAAVPAGAPTGVVGSNATATSVTLNWTPPANDGGSPITRYVLRLSTDGGATWATPWGYPPIITPVPTTWTWTGLTPGTSYRFEVIAVTAVGWGSAWSAPSPAISTAP